MFGFKVKEKKDQIKKEELFIKGIEDTVQELEELKVNMDEVTANYIEFLAVIQDMYA